MEEIIIGCVGKPSAGKSTFFNAVSEGKAKTGNFPFTTIEPNVGVSYFRVDCPCHRRGKSSVCAPKYGWCDGEGGRFIPVKLMDVAGLVPGAAEGAGLGNKFLNDLRAASVLLHIIDVSGTTNEKGEVTVGYDPIDDVEWLESEMHQWVFHNIWDRWDSIARRHGATKATAEATLAAQFSGYGANVAMVAAALKRARVKEPSGLEQWDENKVHHVVKCFIEVRFPTILVLNKAECSGDTDRNIGRICEKYDPEGDRCVVASALTECFLKNLRQKGFIRYPPGSDDFRTLDDDVLKGVTKIDAVGDAHCSLARVDLSDAAGKVGESEGESKAGTGGSADGALLADAESGAISGVCRAKGVALHALKPKMRDRLAKARDMVMFRFGGTGVWDAVQRAVTLRMPVIVYPVTSLTNLSTERSGPGKGGVLARAILVKPETTTRELATKLLASEPGRLFTYAEGEDGRRLGEDNPIGRPGDNVIFKITTHAATPSKGVESIL